MELQFDTSLIAFNSFSNPLLNALNVVENDGTISLDWSNAMATDIINDTLVMLTFDNKAACFTDLDWNISMTNLNYYANIQPSLIHQNGELTFVNSNGVNLFLPPNESITTSLTPTLNWNTDDCTEEYQLQLAEDTLFTNIVIDQTGILDSFFVVTSNLQNGIDYYWRVARMDNLDSLYWSDRWTFKVIGVGTKEVAIEELALKIYPNPFNNFLVLETELEAYDEFLNVSFYNLNGQLLKQEHIEHVGNIRTTINTADLSNGMYIVKIQTKNRVRAVKLVK